MKRTTTTQKRHQKRNPESEPATAAMLGRLKIIGDRFNRELAAQAATKAAGKVVRT